MNERVLVIEDEKNIGEAIAYALEKEGYVTEVVHDGNLALTVAERFKPHAIILDVMLPGMDGYDILKRLERSHEIGIIMLTAKEDIVNKVLGLELGADDYMTKPFDMRELLARLKSLLRRLQPVGEAGEKDELKLGGLALQKEFRRAVAGESVLDLTPKEYDLLHLLVSHPNRVYSREQLLALVWDMDYLGGTRTVDIHIQRLRRKLGTEYSHLIQTVHGVGYRVLGTHHA